MTSPLNEQMSCSDLLKKGCWVGVILEAPAAPQWLSIVGELELAESHDCHQSGTCKKSSRIGLVQISVGFKKPASTYIMQVDLFVYRYISFST